MSAGLSGAFAARGVGRGDVVMTLVGNRLEWVLSLLACWRMGAVALPCNTQLRRKDLELRCGVAKPALCVGDEALLGELPDGIDYMTLAEVGAALDEDHPQETPVAIADLDARGSGADRLHLGHHRRAARGAPRPALPPRPAHPGRALARRPPRRARLVHDRDRVVEVGAQRLSRPLAVRRRRDARRRSLRARPSGSSSPSARASTSSARRRPSTGCSRAAPSSAPVPSLRRLVSAGEALNPEVIAAFRDGLGLEISDGYGQTETGQLTGNLVGEPIREGSMGKALPGFDLRISDDTLEVRVASCPTFFSRYLGDEPFAGEWWSTGDVVRADDDGYLWYEGRDDDLIASAGYRIGPFEVESALLTHPAVAEAAAVAAPDPERGSVVRAIVVLRDGVGTDELARELQEHVKSTTAPYKYPRIVDFADELPKTASGKIKRAELRAGSLSPDEGV